MFEIKKRSINNPDGSIRTTRTTKVTGKGQVYFINKFLRKRQLETPTWDLLTGLSIKKDEFKSFLELLFNPWSLMVGEESTKMGVKPKSFMNTTLRVATQNKVVSGLAILQMEERQRLIQADC